MPVENGNATRARALWWGTLGRSRGVLAAKCAYGLVALWEARLQGMNFELMVCRGSR